MIEYIKAKANIIEKELQKKLKGGSSDSNTATAIIITDVYED